MGDGLTTATTEAAETTSDPRGPELLELALEAHGGLERWRSVRRLELGLRCGGRAFELRFKRGALASVNATIDTASPRVVVHDYPGPGRSGVFEPDLVRIERDDGEVLAERRDPRAGFRRLRRNIWWDDLDLLYFASYALWNYISTPFLFTRPGFSLRELEPWPEEGESWRRLAVGFPADVPTHCPEQVFHFDSRGLLRRLDYTAEVLGSWAKAAHYCFDHKEFSGLVFPTRRRVFPRKRSGQPLSRPTLVWLEVENVEVARDRGLA